MCKGVPGDRIIIERYKNPHKHEEPLPAGEKAGGDLTPGQQTFVDGVVSCRFNLSNFVNQTSEKVNELSPLSQAGSYYSLFAVGPLQYDGK
jgi:hypothetical protein